MKFMCAWVNKSSTFLVHGCIRVIFLHKGIYYVHISPLSSIEID